MSDFNTKVFHFHKFGHGPNILLAFHGIGQDGLNCFKSFEDNLGEYYTIYAFDLFFHGKSISTLHPEFSNNQVITKEYWAKIIQEFLIKENISRFDVAGFSIGGRFALAALESFSRQIDRAFLIAPDGISEHLLYTLASRFALTRHIFRWLMQNPDTFFKATAIFQKAGLIHSSLYKFTQHVLDTPEKRKSVYNSWVAFRKLHYDIPKLYEKIKTDQVDLYLIIGKYDQLLKISAVRKLARLLPADKYIVLQSGHAGIVEKASVYLRQLQ